MILTKTVQTKNLNHVFDQFFNTRPNTWNRDTRSDSTAPSVNIYETEDTYQLELNAPGRSKDEFSIHVERGLLTISYEQKKTDENNAAKVIRKEFSYKSFKRSFTLDDKINAEAIEARYENGILKLTLPKIEEVKPAVKHISIQ